MPRPRTRSRVAPEPDELREVTGAADRAQLYHLYRTAFARDMAQECAYGGTGTGTAEHFLAVGFFRGETLLGRSRDS